MDIRLVGPPQDQTKQSLDRLRTFCQTYVAPDNASPEYAGRKPYEADEIHENGLFFADGLYYFMLEVWAPIMMDPDDASGWDSKRARADAALETYMRRRVGDTGAPVGGTLAGPLSRDGREFTDQ